MTLMCSPACCSGVRSITHPDYTKGCIHPSCPNPETCAGNRLYYLDESKTSLHLHLTHLKTSRWASFTPVSFTLPPELTLIYKAYIDIARGILLRVWDDPIYLFFDDQTGNPLRPQQMSTKFRETFPEHLQKYIPSPRGCRCVQGSLGPGPASSLSPLLALQCRCTALRYKLYATLCVTSCFGQHYGPTTSHLASNLLTTCRLL